MGTVYAELILKNERDIINYEQGLIPEKDIRSATVQAVVDTGSTDMIIPEALREKLGLGIKGETLTRIANGQRVPCQRTETVEIWWKNRSSVIRALVIPGGEEVLMGVIPLEQMDLIVHPKTFELVGAHGDEIVFRA